MRVKIIADRPAKGQTGIAHLIGQVFEVAQRDKDEKGRYTGRVSVIAPEPDGTIILQRTEYVQTNEPVKG